MLGAFLIYFLDRRVSYERLKMYLNRGQATRVFKGSITREARIFGLYSISRGCNEVKVKAEKWGGNLQGAWNIKLN